MFFVINRLQGVDVFRRWIRKDQFRSGHSI
jgi:hypothetical protein